jgi:SRSO17 transposase
MAGYPSSKGYGLIDYELYMPERWFEKDYIERRKKCGVPSTNKFHTKNEILLDMINNISDSGKFPAKYIGVDCAFGDDNSFLDSLPEQLIYFADIPCDRRVFVSRPKASIPTYSGKGRKPSKEKTEFPPLAVKEVVKSSDTPWTRVVLGIGAKGPVIAEEKCLLVVEERGGLPGKDRWLYARKLDNETIKYALCSAPTDALIEDIRKPALMRWSIEQCFKECKEYLGMDQYETRSWDAWHRHMLLTFVAHLFIIKLRIAFSSVPRMPSPTPHIDIPVIFEDYLEAHEQMLCHEPIRHPDIMVKPMNPQQF